MMLMMLLMMEEGMPEMHGTGGWDGMEGMGWNRIT